MYYAIVVFVNVCSNGGDAFPFFRTLTFMTTVEWLYIQIRSSRVVQTNRKRKSGKRRHGRPKTSHNSNITKWMSENRERITRDTRDRDEWRRLVRYAARAADHHSWWDRERESSNKMHHHSSNISMFNILLPSQDSWIVFWWMQVCRTSSYSNVGACHWARGSVPLPYMVCEWLDDKPPLRKRRRVQYFDRTSKVYVAP